MFEIYLPLTLVAVFLNPLTTLVTQASSVETHVNNVVSHLVGVMDTTTQAAKNPNKPSVRMTTCRVQVMEKPNAVYLYQEQALTSKLDRPYRQRLLLIQSAQTANTVESRSFKPTDAPSLIGLCDHAETRRQIPLQQLGESVCSVFLKPTERGYTGETPPKGCPANLNGAVTITNTIILHEEGMDTWDRGFDERGNQVWGAENEGYQYRWLKIN